MNALQLSRSTRAAEESKNSVVSHSYKQALEETFLVARLTVALYSYLGLGTRWTGKLLRLILYATLLLPGFIQVILPLPFQPFIILFMYKVFPVLSGQFTRFIFSGYTSGSGSHVKAVHIIAACTCMASSFPRLLRSLRLPGCACEVMQLSEVNL